MTKNGADIALGLIVIMEKFGYMNKLAYPVNDPMNDWRVNRVLMIGINIKRKNATK